VVGASDMEGREEREKKFIYPVNNQGEKRRKRKERRKKEEMDFIAWGGR
jgi:hypothetical protein